MNVETVARIAETRSRRAMLAANDPAVIAAAVDAAPAADWPDPAVGRWHTPNPSQVRADILTAAVAADAVTFDVVGECAALLADAPHRCGRTLHTAAVAAAARLGRRDRGRLVRVADGDWEQVRAGWRRHRRAVRQLTGGRWADAVPFRRLAEDAVAALAANPTLHVRDLAAVYANSDPQSLQRAVAAAVADRHRRLAVTLLAVADVADVDLLVARLAADTDTDTGEIAGEIAATAATAAIGARQTSRILDGFVASGVTVDDAVWWDADTATLGRYDSTVTVATRLLNDRLPSDAADVAVALLDGFDGTLRRLADVAVAAVADTRPRSGDTGPAGA